jgi:hypothetical protein
VKAIEQTISQKTRQCDISGCLLWTGAKTPGGYGKVGRGGRTIYVHRAVYEANFGPIPAGLVVMHGCDQPSCCNPDHLALGTKADNSLDMVRKGRSRVGARHPLAKLTADDVAEIRRCVARGEKQRSLAARFSVTFQHVSAVVAGKTWAEQ